MPSLKQVLPILFASEDYRDTPAYRLGELEVREIRLTTGAPCSNHSELFAPWPGEEQHVSTWYLLETGTAVGLNEDPEKGLSFPVLSYAPSPGGGS